MKQHLVSTAQLSSIFYSKNDITLNAFLRFGDDFQLAHDRVVAFMKLGTFRVLEAVVWGGLFVCF